MTEAEVDELFAAHLPSPRPGWLGPLRPVGPDDDAPLRPLWDLTDGEARVVEDATPEEALAAWEHAAEWTQGDLDEAERLFRVADASRTRRLLTAYRAALQDLTHRYGTGQGHRGSPGVQLFFAQTGLALGMSPTQVAHRVDTAETLQTRLPRTWQVYLTGTAPWRAVDLAVHAAEGLTADAWDDFDDAVATLLGESVLEPQDAPAISSLPRTLRTIRERVQAETMLERAKRTRDARTTLIEHGHDGQSTLVITGPTVTVTAMDAVLHKAAIAAHGRPDETRGLAQLRFDIVQDLILEGAKTAADPTSTTTAVPGRKGITPTVVITIPVLTLLGTTTEPARLEGVGPIDPDTATALAATAPSFFRLLTHPITGVRLDLDRTTYTPPADLRRWVRLRDETCRFPGCNRPAHRCDLDHAHEWQHHGITAAANLITLSRDHHNWKSTGLTTETLQPDDRVDWDTPWRHLTDPPPDPHDPAPHHLHPQPQPQPEDPCPF